MTPEFTKERDALAIENRELRAANAQLTAERDDARRQRDECAAALATIGHQMEAQQILDATAPATNDDARAILHAMASEPTPLEAAVTARTEHVCCGDCLTAAEVGVSLPGNPIAYVHQECMLHNPPTHTESVAVVVERASIALCLPFPLRIRLPDRHEIAVTTDEAAALITALLADGAVHERWLHGRGGK